MACVASILCDAAQVSAFLSAFFFFSFIVRIGKDKCCWMIMKLTLEDFILKVKLHFFI